MLNIVEVTTKFEGDELRKLVAEEATQGLKRGEGPAMLVRKCACNVEGKLEVVNAMEFGRQREVF